MTLMSGSGTGEHLLANPSILHSHRMVNKSMQCAAKAAENAAMSLRSTAAGERRSPEAADVSSSAAGTRGDAPRDIGDYELELIYSGESDGETDSKEAKAKDELELAKPEPTKSASRSALSLADRPTSPTLRLRDGVVLPKAR